MPSDERLTITVEEAARRLGVGRNSAYEAARSGVLPVIRIGHRLVVPLAAFERMLESPPADHSTPPKISA